MNDFETRYMNKNVWTQKAIDFYDENHLDHNSAYVKKISNGFLLPQKNGVFPWGIGGCLDENGRFVEESSVYNAFGGKYEYNENSVEQIDETIIYIPIIPKHWGHFLIDAVCRLWIFFDKNYTTDHLKIYYNAWGFQNAEISGNYKQFLELAGLYERMVPVSHVIRAKEIWIPSYTMSFSKTYSEKYKLIFEYVISKVMNSSDIQNLHQFKNVYFSRTHLETSKNKEIGEKEFESVFEKNGFKILYPEELSLIEQVFYFQTSDIVCSMSGTIMHNIVFSGKNTKLFILNRTCMMNHPQIMLNKLFPNQVLNIDVYETVTTKFPKDYGTGPFWIEPNGNFKKFLDDFGLQDGEIEYKTHCINEMKYFKSLLMFSLKYNVLTKYVYYSLMKLKK